MFDVFGPWTGPQHEAVHATGKAANRPRNLGVLRSWGMMNLETGRRGVGLSRDRQRYTLEWLRAGLQRWSALLPLSSCSSHFFFFLILSVFVFSFVAGSAFPFPSNHHPTPLPSPRSPILSTSTSAIHWGLGRQYTSPCLLTRLLRSSSLLVLSIRRVLLLSLSLLSLFVVRVCERNCPGGRTRLLALACLPACLLCLVLHPSPYPYPYLPSPFFPGAAARAREKKEGRKASVCSPPVQE
jgi:hypothetical protein